MTATDAPSPFDESGAQYAWDSTSLGWAQDCLRKYYYFMVEQWRPQRPSVHLLFGGWYATALEHYHKAVALGKDHDEALREVVREALTATFNYELEDAETGRKFWIDGLAVQKMANGDFELAWTGEGKPWESDHNLKTRGNLIRTIIWYLDHFKNDTVKVVHLSNGSPAVEYSFSFELADNILYSGHIDRLVEYSGDLFVQDQKTSGYTLSPKYFEQFHHPETQMGGYTYAGKVVLNKPVRGVIIDAAQIAVGFSRFERGFTFRTPDMLDEWRDTTLYHVERARLAAKVKNFPMNPASCDKYGGCPFKSVCARPVSMREQFLKADFYKGDGWNPLARR